CAGVLFLGTWICFWSFATLMFDGTLAISMCRQVAALAFEQTPGVITDSQLITESDGEGTSHKAVISYRYAVGQREFSGSRVRHGSFEMGPHDAQRVVARFPKGTPVRVHYNPRDPADALLMPGLSAGHAFVALFMVPFNIIMLGGWIAIWDWLRS